MQNENKIIEKVLAGETGEFEALVNPYLKPVYNFLYNFTKDRDALDDLTQETFFKAWKNLKKFNQEKSFKTWIFTIAKNSAFDYLKKKKAIPFSWFENEEGYNRLDEIADQEFDWAEISEKNDLEKNLKIILEKLPEHYRVILTLRYKDDFSLQEIAEILEKPYNTIKSQHQRALSALKSYF